MPLPLFATVLPLGQVVIDSDKSEPMTAPVIVDRARPVVDVPSQDFATYVEGYTDTFRRVMESIQISRVDNPLRATCRLMRRRRSWAQ